MDGCVDIQRQAIDTHDGTLALAHPGSFLDLWHRHLYADQARRNVSHLDIDQRVAHRFNPVSGATQAVTHAHKLDGGP